MPWEMISTEDNVSQSTKLVCVILKVEWWGMNVQGWSDKHVPVGTSRIHQH
jgi:hypothetical protein